MNLVVRPWLCAVAVATATSADDLVGLIPHVESMDRDTLSALAARSVELGCEAAVASAVARTGRVPHREAVGWAHRFAATVQDAVELLARVPPAVAVEVYRTLLGGEVSQARREVLEAIFELTTPGSWGGVLMELAGRAASRASTAEPFSDEVLAEAVSRAPMVPGQEVPSGLVPTLARVMDGSRLLEVLGTCDVTSTRFWEDSDDFSMVVTAVLDAMGSRDGHDTLQLVHNAVTQIAELAPWDLFDRLNEFDARIQELWGVAGAATGWVVGDLGEWSSLEDLVAACCGTNPPDPSEVAEVFGHRPIGLFALSLLGANPAVGDFGNLDTWSSRAVHAGVFRSVGLTDRSRPEVRLLTSMGWGSRADCAEAAANPARALARWACESGSDMVPVRLARLKQEGLLTEQVIGHLELDVIGYLTTGGHTMWITQLVADWLRERLGTSDCSLLLALSGPLTLGELVDMVAAARG